MTKLVILPEDERNTFDSPAKLNAQERATCFALDKKLLKTIDALRTSTNKIGFLLQYGYFKATRKFYTSDQFRQKDINYVANILNIDPAKFNSEKYKKKIPSDHRINILRYFNWMQLSDRELKIIKTSISTHVKNQFSPRKLFDLAIDYCWHNKIEVPSYNQLSSVITEVYNEHEQKLVAIVKKLLNTQLEEKLTTLVQNETPGNTKYQRPPITILKQVNQSLRPSQIKDNTNLFTTIQNYFKYVDPILDKLNLSDQATDYFATWVQKAETNQLSSLKNKHKLYLYLISFIKHQYYYRSDTLISIFIKSVQSTKNYANKLLLEHDKANKPARNKAIKKLTRSFGDAYELIGSLNKIVFNNPALTKEGKYDQMERLLEEFNNVNDEMIMQNIVQLGDTLNKDSKNYYDILESLSIKLQRRVANIVKLLDFNADTSNSDIINSIEYFRTNNGEIGTDAPVDFLNNDEKDIIFAGNKLRVSLYKILLFFSIADAIKSGKLTLKYSHDYRSFDEYLINKNIWNADRDQLLRTAGLLDYLDFDSVMMALENKLSERYETVNKKILNNKNKYVSLDDSNIKVSTPKASNNKNEYISNLLTNLGYVPILQILSDIETITNFTSYFKHHSVKSNKMSPSKQVIFAGILGKGCNIGINKIANISVGISEGVLRNTVRWCFSLKNIHLANNIILAMINKLSLANAFKKEPDSIHTGSDGSKLNVAVDSLNANYSFKYFGKGKGSTMYTFLDECNALFYSTVISSSEREAAYVIDGLLQNDVIQSNLHSTDTHGFTETIFAATHFIGTAFAPRFKQIAKQYLYSFKTCSSYRKKGYKILPSRKININLIRSQWDNILRFMATIKVKHASASTLFKRLSSYAKDHPLYRALKEFGRIIKSIFILTYYDDVKLRQSIEKQLNKVELSHKFSKAIFFANNQEFQFGEKHDQEINIACMSLIQNCIVLWNYLYLSQLLINNSDQESKQQMLLSIKAGSAITWHHINLHGEYDFTKNVANDKMFDMKKILSLNVR